MGIVNVTPDSFYDGGRHDCVDAAVEHALMLVEQGADIIDIGGASSRPGSVLITPAQELRRVLPVVEKLVKYFKGPISVDTPWSEVAAEVIDAGAQWINDISAGRFDKRLIPLIAGRGCTIVVMHSRGTPQSMQQCTSYKNVTPEVKDELLAAVAGFINGGVKREKIILDPGIGFAKTAQQNVELLQNLEEFTNTGYSVLIGTSRKSFIGSICGKEVNERLYGTLGTVASAFSRGVRFFRVHDIKETADFLKVFSVIENNLPIDHFC
ncbi:MAG TPA: dihydropteroate synthase [Chitinispirillaceae bacterium]|nr:dihydropteroate synthase [Chitinispirillaceae bacterium]